MTYFSAAVHDKALNAKSLVHALAGELVHVQRSGERKRAGETHEEREQLASRQVLVDVAREDDRVDEILRQPNREKAHRDENDAEERVHGGGRRGPGSTEKRNMK